MYGSNCKGAEEEGVSILHGNRGVYHDDKQPAFKVVYDAVRDVGILLTQNGIALLTIPDYLRQEPAEMFSFACLYDTIFCFFIDQKWWREHKQTHQSDVEIKDLD